MEAVVEKIVCVHLDADIWTGARKLAPKDLGLSSIPEELVGLGFKRVVDPEALRPFHRIHRRAVRACLKVGTRFLGGYAVPEDRAKALEEELAALKDEFEEAREAFLDEYERAVEEWADAHPEWRETILSSAPKRDEVERKLRFRPLTYKVGGGNVEEAIEELPTGILKEVAQEAKTLLGKLGERATQKAVKALDALLDKLRGLSFLDADFDPMVEAVEGMMASLPKGPMEGDDLLSLAGILSLLADPAKMRDIASAAAYRPRQRQAELPTPEPPSEESSTEEPSEEMVSEESPSQEPEEPQESEESSPEEPREPGEIPDFYF